MSAPRRALAVAAAVIIVCASPLAAQPSKSAPLGAELASVLQQRQLPNIAAKDPDRPGFFVAALHLPGSQLLVVSARSTGPEYVEQVLLAASRYEEVYSSLNLASSPDGRFFVQDMGCDGLGSEPGKEGALDSYRDAKRSTIFNGDWKKQDLTEQEYKATFEAADAAYAKALSLLLQEARRPAGQ